MFRLMIMLTHCCNKWDSNQQKLLLLNLTHINVIDFKKGILFCDMLHIETGLQFTYLFTTVPVIKELTCFSQTHSGYRACIYLSKFPYD